MVDWSNLTHGVCELAYALFFGSWLKNLDPLIKVRGNELILIVTLETLD